MKTNAQNCSLTFHMCTVGGIYTLGDGGEGLLGDLSKITQLEIDSERAQRIKATTTKSNECSKSNS